MCKSTAVTKLYRLSATEATVKEDLTTEILALCKAGTCPALSKVTGGGEDELVHMLIGLYIVVRTDSGIVVNLLYCRLASNVALEYLGVLCI